MKTERTTAVLLRDHGGVQCSLFHGTPVSVAADGPYRNALFPDAAYVGYRITNGKREHAFLFRTNPKHGAQVVPGVSPSVMLLVDAKSRYRSAKLQEMLQVITESGLSISEVPDHVFLRFNTVLEGSHCSTQSMKTLVRKWGM